MKTAIVFCFTATVFMLSPHAVLGANLWVAPTGNDAGNNCQTNTNPCQTIQ